MEKYLDRIFYAVQQECHRQVTKHGTLKHPANYWLAILAEEFGEVARGVVQCNINIIRIELVHCTAVCFSWLAQYEAEFDEEKEKKQHEQNTPTTIRKSKSRRKIV